LKVAARISKELVGDWMMPPVARMEPRNDEEKKREM
jgi:hypothetical protein